MLEREFLLPRGIHMSRMRQRMEDTAQERGHDTAAMMYHEMYIVKRMTFKEMSLSLHVPLVTLQNFMREASIEFRGRGGRRDKYVKFEITPEIVQQVSREGLGPVAERIGATPGSLQKRLLKWLEENPQ